MHRSRRVRCSLEDGEAALRTMVGSVGTDGSWNGPWAYEITDVVKHCGVVSGTRKPVLQVNPLWLRELLARRELGVLADEMRTWSAIQNEVRRQGCQRAAITVR